MLDTFRIMRPAFLIVILQFLFGCSSDIDILTEKNRVVPVVFGLINPWDSVHNIRVQRTFLIRDKEGAKLQEPDSLFFQDVDIRISGLVNGEEKFSFNFEKVFVDKDTGNFTGINHHVYRLNQKLPIQLSGVDRFSPGHPDIEYLYISMYIHDLDTLIQHQIPVFSPVLIRNTPLSKKVIVYGNKTTNFSPYYISISKQNRLEAGEIEFRFHISEYGEGFAYDTVYCYDGFNDLRKPEFLFNRILMAVRHTQGSIRTRVFHSMDVHWTLTDMAFIEYNRVNKYWTELLDYPYSQIPGVYGFISPKIDGELNGLVLDKRTMDSLCNGEKWKHLKFKSW